MSTTELALDQPHLPDSEGGLPAPPVTLIEPPRAWQLINVREMWRYRELLYFFTWRDVKVRYKQTLLGAAWAVLQPAMMMVVFTIFLGRMAGVSSGDFPYPVFVYAGLLPWTFFSTAISSAGNSVVGSQSIVTKIYFPRLIIPFASVGAAVVDFGIAFVMLGVLMAYYGIAPSWPMLLVPLLLVLSAMAALGIGSMLAALNVAYRDFKYTIPFLVQVWMFATPTVYMNIEETAASDAAQKSTTATTDIATSEAATTGAPAAASSTSEQSQRGELPAGLKAVLHLNPMTGVIGFFRAATLGGPLPWRQLGYSTATIFPLLLVGLFYFRHMESGFADII